MTGGNPWDRNVGRFDVPSSAVPVAQPVSTTAGTRKRRVGAEIAEGPGDVPMGRPATRHSALETRMMAAERDGVVAIGAASIVARIDEAMIAIVGKGHGNPTAIYLVDSDLLALRDARGTTPGEYRELRVASGATSKVYSKRGSVPIRRPKASASSSGPSLFGPPG